MKQLDTQRATCSAQSELY